MMKEELGDDYTYPSLFRFGASALLGDLERQLYYYVTGQYPAQNELPMGWWETDIMFKFKNKGEKMYLC